MTPDQRNGLAALFFVAVGLVAIRLLGELWTGFRLHLRRWHHRRTHHRNRHGSRPR